VRIVFKIIFLNSPFRVEQFLAKIIKYTIVDQVSKFRYILGYNREVKRLFYRIRKVVECN
jgi:hypothetical protein